MMAGVKAGTVARVQTGAVWRQGKCWLRIFGVGIREPDGRHRIDHFLRHAGLHLEHNVPTNMDPLMVLVYGIEARECAVWGADGAGGGSWNRGFE